ncbi:dTDP-glucose 4,6-dehydratase [Alloscardovia venturai]|uniref:dTDP-glucose 4,6-dehydratase n=1 Tax=Alloscardovia venturai TaxID=1769421 RepID=A0ABW2Y9F6_9BIFI
MHTLLVTGGAGFIGSNFVRYVSAHAPHIRMIVLDALTYAGNIANLDGVKNVEFVHGSITDEKLVDSLMSRVDTVVHFAAESHNDRAITQPRIFFETNVMGTLILLQAAVKYDVRFHHISTDEVFGDTALDSTEKFTESSSYKPSSPYAASKAASDHMVRAWVRTYGLRATISNCSNNYGPFQHIEKFIPRAITNALCGLPIKLYGDGLAVRDWIHVEDQCSAIWEILQNGHIGQTYLVGANCTINNAHVVNMLEEILPQYCGEQKITVEHVRDRLGADRRYALDPHKIVEELGWKAKHTDFRKGLSQTVEWYANHQDWWEAYKPDVERSYANLGQ